MSWYRHAIRFFFTFVFAVPLTASVAGLAGLSRPQPVG